MTGCNHGKHGVFDFVSAKQGTFNIVNATAVDAAPLWDLLSAQGKRVGVLNVPVTYPPWEVNGFMISGFETPNIRSDFTYPPDLKDEILRRWPDYTYRPERLGQNHTTVPFTP